MNILYSGLSGVGTVFFSFKEADKKNLFEYEALFCGIEDLREEYVQRCAKQKIKWYFSKKYVKIDPLYYFKMFRFIIRSKPDIIFLHGCEYILLAKLYKLISSKKKYIIVCEHQANQLKVLKNSFWSFWALLMANKFVFLTKEYAREMKKYYKWIYKENKIAVIANGINLELYRPAHTKPIVSTFNIGMQGRLVSIKDHETLIKAFALLKKAEPSLTLKLLIAGDGEYKQHLINLTSNLGLTDDVTFTGLLEEKDLISFLQSLNLYVHASYGETMSTAIMQAMACGLPIIASDVFGINNMVQNGVTGILTPVKDEVSLANNIKEMITNNDLRNSLSNNAFNYSQLHFSNTKMFEGYKSLLCTLG